MDVALFPLASSPECVRISTRFSPPEVCQFRSEQVGVTTDVFHLAAYAYHALADLLPYGFPGRGLEAFNFEFPKLRVFTPSLPIGIWPVIEQGLSLDPACRQATVAVLLEALRHSLCRASERSRIPRADARNGSSSGILSRVFRWIDGRQVKRVDVGHCTDAGIAKSSLQLPNQDVARIEWLPLPTREALLVVVADGVTTSRVGTGETASGIACDVISSVVRESAKTLIGAVEWLELLENACLAASDAIVRTALQTNEIPADVQDHDLMSTTAVVGVLDGETLFLANVGDSRAYLIDDEHVEQLTVDGDVGTSMIANGTAPETANELGAQAKALRYCLGACARRDDGSIACDKARSRPQSTRWRVLPTDTIVICSDGLVEEGVFLEPSDLSEMIRSFPSMSAQQLAEHLVAEANRKQRPATPNEPCGFGDNVTCAVIRISPAHSLAPDRSPNCG
jgi:protein phosphatase